MANYDNAVKAGYSQEYINELTEKAILLSCLSDSAEGQELVNTIGTRAHRAAEVLGIEIDNTSTIEAKTKKTRNILPNIPKPRLG